MWVAWLAVTLLALGVVAVTAQAVDWLPDFGFSKDEEEAKQIWDGGGPVGAAAKAGRRQRAPSTAE